MQGHATVSFTCCSPWEQSSAGDTCLTLHLCCFLGLMPLPPTAGCTGAVRLLAATAAVVCVQDVVCHGGGGNMGILCLDLEPFRPPGDPIQPRCCTGEGSCQPAHFMSSHLPQSRPTRATSAAGVAQAKWDLAIYIVLLDLYSHR